MNDLLLELSKNPWARKLVSQAKLPIPMPSTLVRPSGPAVERFLEGKSVRVAGEGALIDALSHVLARAGANVLLFSAPLLAAFASPAEAYGRALRVLDDADTKADPDTTVASHALVLDATRLSSPTDLELLFDFFQAGLRSLAPSGRVLVLGRPSEQAKTVAQAATAQALEGFTRSLAKEVGKKGATANLVLVSEGAEAEVPAVLRFFLSSASAFVSAQPLLVRADPRATKSDPWTRPLAHKIALVTGAARGIGEATAEILAGEGAHVVCLDRPEDGEALSLVARNIDGSPLLADVSATQAGAQIADELMRRHGGVDIVVHNAGITRDRTLGRMPKDAWDQVIGINLQAIIGITQALLDTGALRDDGRIVSLASVAGIAGNVGQTNYAASKAGVIGFTHFLSKQLRERGITVNAVAPGFIETRMTAHMPTMIREAGRRLSALGQGGLPEDVARTIAFLAAPGAAGVTGQVLRVCGGALIGA